jgi:hypothetical protein
VKLLGVGICGNGDICGRFVLLLEECATAVCGVSEKRGISEKRVECSAAAVRGV